MHMCCFKNDDQIFRNGKVGQVKSTNKSWGCMDSFATKTLSCRIYPLQFCLIGQLHDDVTDVILLQLPES